jgi:hypothetical protein
MDPHNHQNKTINDERDPFTRRGRDQMKEKGELASKIITIMEG